ncbi:sensor histidine kinase [Chryseobacterium sp. A301]
MNKSPAKFKPLIQYSLIACLVLIQGIILMFFYNEYFNSRKLETIRKQLVETRGLTQLMQSSRSELIVTQYNLQKYISGNEKKYLDSYFTSLRKLTQNIDSINTHPDLKSTLRGRLKTQNKQTAELSDLERLIETVYQDSKSPEKKSEPITIENYNIEEPKQTFNVEFHRSTPDTSATKKKLLPRLKDAITGNVEVKRDTVYIETFSESTLDTTKIKKDFDSAVTAVNNHYLREIKKYESRIETTSSKSSQLYENYDHLIILSNDLMDVYESTIRDVSLGLQKEYDQQNSKNNKIRRNTMLGLLVMIFFVLIVVLYYTKQSFLYEKQLRLANQTISNSLNFKNRVLGMLSHEIRAPLKIINLFTSRIARKTEDPTVLEALKSIEFTNNSLLIQANQILEYTKNQNQKIELKEVDFNLYEEISALLHVFKPYIESRNNTFEILNTIDPSWRVHADNIKIHQILTNVLGNASKFTENGKITIKAAATPLNDKTLTLHVVVKDTGIGISKSDLKKIFQPYYQGLVSEEIDNLGAGLGLNLCKEIVDLFGGTISADSKLGEGTEIQFRLNLDLVK